jgi:acetylornithine deacetylase/succinyl-diaminopimelate desuccinylase-like protein
LPAYVQVFGPAPRKGNLVARLRGSGARKPILLLAHLDAVEAKRKAWSVDPFKLLEHDGFFYGRGTGDDKFMAAAFVANLIRYRREGYKPDRDILVVLETDEEILDRDGVGMQWLVNNHRDLIDAEFALNEGAGVGLKDGKPLRIGVQIGEKVPVNYVLEVKNPGGHSSLPAKDNAIYRLAEGLVRLKKCEFPVQLNDTTRAWLRCAGALEQPQVAADMRSVASGHPDPGAVEQARLQRAAAHDLCRNHAGGGSRVQRVAANRSRDSQLSRTAWQADGGGSENAGASAGRSSDLGHTHLDARGQRAVPAQSGRSWRPSSS